MFREIKNAGQSSVEFSIVLGFIVIPALAGTAAWIRNEWKKNECAFQNFKTARVQMIRTQKASSSPGITILPLEDLDHHKGPLAINDMLSEVSALWAQLSL